VKRTPLLLLAALLALAPRAAHADGAVDDPLTNDPNGNPCFAVDDVAAQMDFGEPNSAFARQPNCPSLCKKAGAVCQRYVKRAASCRTAFARDAATFKIKKLCDGLTGADLRTCQAPFQTERDTAISGAGGIDELESGELSKCGDQVTSCTAQCGDPNAPAPRGELGTAFSGLPCADPNDAAQTFDFSGTLIGVTNCTHLCVQAFNVCRRSALDAASCQLSLVNDWIGFDSQVDCAGLKGSELSDCRNGWSEDERSWRQAIINERAGVLGSGGACASTAQKCLNCSGQ